jgi:hypothetical protein
MAVVSDTASSCVLLLFVCLAGRMEQEPLQTSECSLAVCNAAIQAGQVALHQDCHAGSSTTA